MQIVYGEEFAPAVLEALSETLPPAAAPMMIPFFHSTVGIGVVTAVAALIGLGALVIRKIVNIQV